jgi:hypothetical protein
LCGRATSGERIGFTEVRGPCEVQADPDVRVVASTRAPVFRQPSDSGRIARNIERPTPRKINTRAMSDHDGVVRHTISRRWKIFAAITDRIAGRL